MAEEVNQKQVETALAPKPNAIMTRRGIEPQTLEEAWRFANCLAESTLVPSAYQKNAANCFIAIDLAARMGSNWLAVMQHVYVVHGRPGLDAAMAIGLVNQSGVFDTIQYEVEGGDNAKDSKYRVRAFSMRKGTETILYGPWIDWPLVKGEGWDKKDGSKWLTMPDQMFHYRAGSWWQKRYCPEMTLGMPTTDELADAGPRIQYIESKTLEPTQGRESFGFKKGEQPPDQPPAEEPETTKDDTSTRLCPAYNTRKIGKFFRCNGQLVCPSCLAKANGTISPTPQTPLPQEGAKKEPEGTKNAKEGGPAPAAGPSITPDAKCKCTRGHEFLGKDAAEGGAGGVCCPTCGEFLADIQPAAVKAQTSVVPAQVWIEGPPPRSSKQSSGGITNQKIEKRYVCAHNPKHDLKGRKPGELCPACLTKIVELELRF